MDANGPDGPAARLSEAQTKLDQALARLDAALRARAQRTGASDRKLAEELEAARSRCAALEEQAQTVSQRLDAAIGRVRSLLER